MLKLQSDTGRSVVIPIFIAYTYILYPVTEVWLATLRISILNPLLLALGHRLTFYFHFLCLPSSTEFNDNWHFLPFTLLPRLRVINFWDYKYFNKYGNSCSQILSSVPFLGFRTSKYINIVHVERIIFKSSQKF